MALAGYEGKVKIGANNVAEINEWSIDEGVDTEETTSFDSNGNKEYIPTLYGWSGSLSGNWAINTDTNGQKALYNAFRARTKLAVTFVATTGVSWTGDIIITSVPQAVNVGGKIEFSMDFQGTGPLTPSGI